MDESLKDDYYEDVWWAGDDNGETCPTKTKKVRGAEYPQLDVDGRTLFVNSHFDNEEEAWEYMVRNTEAAVSLAAGAYKRALRDAEAKTAELAAEAARLVDLKNAYERWRRDRAVAELGAG